MYSKRHSHRNAKRTFFYFLFCADPILLFTKPRERSVADGEGGDEVSRAGSVLAGGYTVQRQRGHQARQGPTLGRGAVRTRLAPRPHRRAPRARALPPGRLRRAPERRRGEEAPRPGQRARARFRPARRGALVAHALGLHLADVARSEAAAEGRVVPAAQRLRLQRGGAGGAAGELVSEGVVRVGSGRVGKRVETVCAYWVRATGDPAA